MSERIHKSSDGRRSRRYRSSSSRRRARWRRLILVLVVLLLLPGFAAYLLWERGWVPAHQAADEWYEVSVDHDIRVQLPRDDAFHDNTMEWWYYNGHLRSRDGNLYSFHYTIFLVNQVAVHTVAHVSLSDHQTGRHYTDQKRTVGNPSRGVTDGFDFTLGDWRVAGGNGRDQLRVNTRDFSFNLRLSEGAPPVLQGGSGLLDFEFAGESYYYTRPRMPIAGSIKIGDEITEVTGVGWFDHQWGDFDVFQLGWKWFAIQLDDGSDVMLYELFDRGGLPVLRSGTIARDGVTRVLKGEDFQVRATDHWVSKTTRVRYPSLWVVDIPGQDIHLRIIPRLPESEFDGRMTAYVLYWEGSVTIEGSHAGEGFVELSGFDRLTKDESAGALGASAESGVVP